MSTFHCGVGSGAVEVLGSPVAGRHTNRSASGWRPGSGWDWRGIVIPALIVLVLVAAAVAFANFNSSNHEAAASGAGDGSSSTSPTPAAATSSGSNSNSSRRSNALAGCVQLFNRQLAATSAANASIDQWKLHIQAMNQLVAGQITLQQATKFWAQTRMGAIHKVQAFDKERKKLIGLQCPGQSSSGPQLTACQRATTAYAKVVKAARATIRTWHMHVQEMEDLRAGRITPTQALHMWHRMWHRGERQVHHYHQTLQAAQHQTCAT